MGRTINTIKRISTAITTNRIPGLFTIFLACFLIVVHVRLYPYAFDDAFIHFRVARQLFETGTPYYNLNEIVKVSTSSGWIVFLTLLFGIARLVKIGSNFPLMLGIVNAFLSFCGMLVYTKIIETLQKKQLPFPTKMLFQISFLALLLPSSIGLMEMPFALVVAGSGIYLLLLSKPSGFALLGLAVYIRLELLILLALASLFLALRKQFRLRQIIGYMALGALPLLVYDLYFFHTVIPQSVITKSIIYSVAWYETVFEILLYSLPAIPINNGLFYLIMYALLFIIILFIAKTVFTKCKWSKNFWPLLFCLWSLLVVVGYILGRAMVFKWYVPLYTIPFLVACFLYYCTADAPRNLILNSFLYCLFLSSTFSIARTLYASTYDPSAFTLFEQGSRVKSYLNIGAILNEDYPNAALLSSEIGGLGYAFRGRILDAAGLASPGALAFHPMKFPEQRLSGIIGAIPPGYVKAIKPDLIVSYDCFMEALMNDEVIRQYHEFLIPPYLSEDAIHSKSKTLWGSQYLRVYIRKDLPISERIYALEQ